MRLSMRQKRTLTKISWRIGAAAAVVLIIAAPGGEPQPASADPAATIVAWSPMLGWQMLALVGIATAICAYLWFERTRLTEQ